MKLSCGSLFSGIGGFDLGFEQSGMITAWQVEQEPFCLKVLASRFPHAERFTDVRTVGIHNLKPVDVITGGFPCQDVSVAGKRAGLAGERTGLFYDAARILQELRPTWFVFENVPGLLSSNNGRDFAEVLRVLMVECGYGVSWRVLNSQFFGVAQRRRRVFIVGRLGRPCPAEVLFESEGGGRDSAKGGQAWADLANTIAGGTGRAGSRGCDDGANIAVIEQNTQCSTPSLPSLRSHGTPNYGIAAPLTRGSSVSSNAPGRRREDDENLAIVRQAISSKWAKGSSGPAGDEHHNLVAATLRASDGHHGRSSPRGDGQDNLVAALTPVRGGPDDDDAQAGHIVIQDVRGGTRDRTDSGQGIGITEGGPCYTLSKTEQHAVAFTLPSAHRGVGNGHNTNHVIGTQRADAGAPKHASDERQLSLSQAPDPTGVRSFAGLPEGMDSARYRALGNAVTVSVARWIAERIVAYESGVQQ
jgi:site-specific DNA-cytosine methylase